MKQNTSRKKTTQIHLLHPIAVGLCQIDLRHHAPLQLRQRPVFVQAVEQHWSRSPIKPNRLTHEIL